eukprot:TRINITY_DN39144_c0_g1_i1.p1 TRINITY_DN39144_c0_g1~~TRINITY_DN39144_c0_g1_i1.p1  ORF type:complete len:314 (-),score=59.85 TRINITY_DN39144_c0_g1_i1:52-993(-)
MTFNNMYVAIFADDLDEEMLREIFAKYGNIISAKVLVSEDGKSRGFGMVSFEESKAAEEAVQSVNGTDIGGRVIYCGPAEKFKERRTELEERLQQIGSQSSNVYVKHLDDTIDDERLHREFSRFGTICSAKVMTDEHGQSKGFGFVWFSSHEEALDAVVAMHWTMLNGKPLYVALAQSKEERRAGYQQHRASQEQQLAAQERHVFLTTVATVQARLKRNGLHQLQQIAEVSVRRRNTSVSQEQWIGFVRRPIADFVSIPRFRPVWFCAFIVHDCVSFTCEFCGDAATLLMTLLVCSTYKRPALPSPVIQKHWI